MDSVPFYKQHVFFCTNERDSGDCCMSKSTKKAQKHARDLVKDLGLKGKGRRGGKGRRAFAGALSASLRATEFQQHALFLELYTHVDQAGVQRIAQAIAHKVDAKNRQ